MKEQRMFLSLPNWAMAPVRTGWAVKPIQFGLLPSGTLATSEVAGTAPTEEEGKIFFFEARIAEESAGSDNGDTGSPGWRLIAKGPAAITGGYFEFYGSYGLDLGRSLRLDGPKREFRVLARELRASEQDRHSRHTLELASKKPGNYIGDTFVAGTGTTTFRLIS
ncbi:hypothetical protein F4553_000874 [Allocatelliglobosispora scoriae]|uniref:Uncharacterized protein n=1 Tax=Allocatelliglobosispora scoriae TaxID=643052 RepID=A0A841BIQ7_9ACTN|nr:hypothetical protein [Allocatelliglobosispora scoriae]MBB5867495.1 hypothetical protein [Allocatelliglobosispora scoriae]